MKQLLGWRLWALTPLGLAMLGCAVAPPVDEAGPHHPESSLAQPASAPQGNPAVLALVETATRQQQAGHDEQAAAALERALRLEPRDAMLWHHLAQVRLSQGQWRDAIDLASKSNSLAGGERDLQASNWLVIAQAKQRQGDREGAEAARARMEAGGATQTTPLESGVR
jgi:predicted Zn-dependent protease